ncbi:glycosyltransferase family 4 protein [Serratia fonticola]|nr:glycosyltransferase family 4 protein [Serratia fonticola]
MKVLHISDKFEGGGAEAVFRDTLRISSELGFENHTLCSDGEVSVFSYIFSFKYFFKTVKILNDIKPDIIHIHNYYHFLTPSILCAIGKYKKKEKCKVIYTAHDYHLVCPNSGFQFFKNGERKSFDPKNNNIKLDLKFDHRSSAHSLLKKAQHIVNYRMLNSISAIDHIISPSYFLMNVFKAYGITKKISVIRNPVKFLPIDKINKNHCELVNLVFMGRLSAEKGIIEFINKINKESTKNIAFHLYGDGELKEEIKKMTIRDGVKIIQHGFRLRDDLIAEISKYDIFVLPSIWFENAPISIIEAAAAGLPVLVPNYGGMIEMANLTLYHYEYNYDSWGIDSLIDNALKHKGMNRVADENSLSYENYKNEIDALYR